MSDCVFCRIGRGEIPVNMVAEDDLQKAFPDVHPQAPTHLLVIPKQHFAHVEEVPAELLGHLLHVAAQLGASRLPGGHRIVINTGLNGGQTVHHLHLHVVGGRPMSWPPG